MRVADGPVHGPCHGSRANDTGAAASSKMRDSPKELTAAPHEVSPHVMKPSRPPRDAGARGVREGAYSGIRSRSAMMPRQYAQDGVAVRLTGVQARSRGEREGQCSVTHGLRKLDRPNIQ